RTFWTAGRRSPIRIAIIAITTNSSISVKPERLRRMGETSGDRERGKETIVERRRTANKSGIANRRKNVARRPRDQAPPCRAATGQLLREFLSGRGDPELRDLQPDVFLVRVEDDEEPDPRRAELGRVFVLEHVRDTHSEPLPPPGFGGLEP